MRRILLIDDDTLLAAPLATFFGRFEFALEAATTPSAGLARLRGEPRIESRDEPHVQPFDAAILDVMLPEMDGFELCRTIRRDADAALRELPIIMLTARGDVMDRVVGLEIGADDYLPKPFEPRELLARLQTVLRRARPSATEDAATQLRFDGLLIDLERRSVTRGDVTGNVTVDLTSTEFDLLALLASQPGTVFDRDQILNRLRGIDADLHTRAVDLLVSRLRKKLEPLDPIKTLRNAGYTFAGARG